MQQRWHIVQQKDVEQDIVTESLADTFEVRNICGMFS
jgi:hypothetical protein